MAGIYTPGHVVPLPVDPSYYHARRPLFVYLGPQNNKIIVPQQKKAYHSILNEAFIPYTKIREKYQSLKENGEKLTNKFRDAEYKPVIRAVLQKVKFVQQNQEWLEDDKAYRKVADALKAKYRQKVGGGVGAKNKKEKIKERDWKINYDLATGKRQRHPSQIGKPLQYFEDFPLSPPESSNGSNNNNNNDSSGNNNDSNSIAKVKEGEEEEEEAEPPEEEKIISPDESTPDTKKKKKKNSSTTPPVVVFGGGRVLPISSSRNNNNRQQQQSHIGGKSPRFSSQQQQTKTPEI